MAHERWIDAAARKPKRRVGGGMEELAQHVLSLARADKEREAEERQRACSYVSRLADAGQLLDMLGLSGEATGQPGPQAAEGVKGCRKCGLLLPLGEFPPRSGRRDGRDSYCKPCHREMKRERTEERAAT